MALRTACLSPPGSWSSLTPAGTVRAPLASLLLGMLTDMLGEGMGRSQAPSHVYFVPAVPTCPVAACSCSQTGESCSH